MIVSDENIAWAIEKLSLFAEYPGFPKKSEALKYHAIAFLHVVENKPMWQIIQEGRKGLPKSTEEDCQDWERRTGLSRDLNDVDWVIALLFEGIEDKYPFPPVVRAAYDTLMTPADGKHVVLITDE